MKMHPREDANTARIGAIFCSIEFHKNRQWSTCR